MKNIFVTMLFFTMGMITCYAQVEENSQSKLNTIFDSEKNLYSGYGYPIIGTTSVLNDKFGLTIGAGANLLINHKFYVGAFGETFGVIIDKVKMKHINGVNFGGVIGYIYGIENPINFDFNMRIGGSYFETIDKKKSQHDGNIDTTKYDSSGYLFNPRVGMNFNNSKFSIVNISLGYRFYLENSASYSYLRGQNFSGPSLSLQLYFGSF